MSRLRLPCVRRASAPVRRRRWRLPTRAAGVPAVRVQVQTPHQLVVRLLSGGLPRVRGGPVAVWVRRVR